MDTGKICPDVLEVFENESLVKICAPMVRYSKLQFRQLVRNYDCNICYTPMIIADSFCKSLKARNNEFTTNILDTPLIIQFAANTVHDFVNAAHLSSVFCSGVDLNCGCPQRWAKDQGLGCVMLENPQTIFDITRQCRNVISKPFTVSVKMRISKDSRKSVEICKQLEKAGASYLTVHARTPAQITGNINVGTLKLIKENVTIPIVANGGIKSLEDCIELQETTRCNASYYSNFNLSKALAGIKDKSKLNLKIRAEKRGIFERSNLKKRKLPTTRNRAAIIISNEWKYYRSFLDENKHQGLT